MLQVKRNVLITIANVGPGRILPHLTNIRVINPNGVSGELEGGPSLRPGRVAEVRDLLRPVPPHLPHSRGPD